MEIKINTQERNYILKPNLSEEISQNIDNTVTRIKCNVPLARHKGIIVENIDKPQEIVKASIAADILEEITREEPRFKTEEIHVSDIEGLSGKLSIGIKGGIDNE